MKIQKLAALLGVMLGLASTAGCGTWDSMSNRQKTAVGGAALGGVAGALITNGGVLGTVGGAAIVGVVGDQLGK